MDDADDAAGHDAQISSSGTVRLERSGLTETEQRIVGKLAREGLVLDEGNSSEASLFLCQTDLFQAGEASMFHVRPRGLRLG